MMHVQEDFRNRFVPEVAREEAAIGIFAVPAIIPFDCVHLYLPSFKIDAIRAL
jgi:hypothetical protein